MLCMAISWADAADLDKFVAFIGSFAWYVLVQGGIVGSLTRVSHFSPVV
jgi:hypothetical protein